MSASVTRAAAVAAIGALTILAPILGRGTAVLFGGIAIIALAIPRGRSIFDLFAGPGDVESGRLYRLAGFALAVTALAILATVEGFGLPIVVLTLTVLLLVGGNLAEAISFDRGAGDIVALIAFCSGAVIAGLAGVAVFEAFMTVGTDLSAATATFLAVGGALVAALCRTDLYRRDDPVVLLSVGLVLWLLSALPIEPSPRTVALALVVTVLLGVAAYLTETASIAGMLTGVLLGFVTIVLGGFHWFVALFAFFAIGGLATKYRYEEKEARGVAEDARGARGTGNVLGNSLVALVAVVGYAAAPELQRVDAALLALAFGGAVGTALADTLSSEIGSLYDGTRLITTFESVEPGTDGGITVQGLLAGVVGAAIIGGIAMILIVEIGPRAGIVVVAGGVVGMTADSLLGATLENRFISNQTVNLAATAVGAGSTMVAGILLDLV